ncbi:MAG: carboxylating nicotinate-nucleotide diphosphorylase [Balneolales bacterium]|nr:carboxylating nicotinate-nucleotide diphosphorylase [Balneolales bacterium]
MNELVKKIVSLALAEDIGQGDVTTAAVFRKNVDAEATFIAKEAGIIAGCDLARFIFSEVNNTLVFESLIEDGSHVHCGDAIAVVKGDAGAILTGERTVLNFMQRMSGIATKTHRFCEALSGTSTKLLDTRKTMPGQRYLDKWAVRLGGGTNHRFCLDDMYLIKENHINVAGSVREAILRCVSHRSESGRDIKIEVEVETLEQIQEALDSGGADIMLLDNMDLPTLKQAVKHINGRVKTEASGNMTIERLPEVASTGVDFISVGGITHSVHALDISLLFE